DERTMRTRGGQERGPTDPLQSLQITGHPCVDVVSRIRKTKGSRGSVQVRMIQVESGSAEGAVMTWMIPPRLEPRTLLTWLTWQSTLLVVVLFLAFKATERVVLGRHWYLFGRLGLAELLLLALLVGGFTWYVRQRVQRALDAVERQRQQAQALAAENAAVVRAVRAVVREFAQPLSGVLSYSELLLLRTEHLAADERHEVTRLCEGVVRLEQLLQTVRQTVDRAPSAATDAHVADVVERSIAPAHVQWPLHTEMSDDSSTPSWS